MFNNTGGNHGDVNDFNNISSFGFKFVQGTTNSPNTHTATAQYYSWSMGLGINYAYSDYVCQFAMPRGGDTPVLSVRFRESGVWGLWQRFSAGYATSANFATTASTVTTANLFHREVARLAVI